MLLRICFTANDFPLPGGPNTASDKGRRGCGWMTYPEMRSPTAFNWIHSFSVKTKSSPTRFTSGIGAYGSPSDAPYSRTTISSASSRESALDVEAMAIVPDECCPPIGDRNVPLKGKRTVNIYHTLNRRPMFATDALHRTRGNHSRHTSR